MELLKLDIKDKRILKELFVNARMPYSRIAKKVGLSKEVVHYRVNRMKSQGLLKGFNSVYDVKRMGWQIYLSYIKLKNLDNNKEKLIITMLVNHPNIAQVFKCIGNYDLVLKFFVKNNSELNLIIKQIENEIDMHLKEYVIDLVEVDEPVPVSYLYSPIKMNFEEKFKKRNSDEIKIDATDIKLLKELSINARKPLSEIAKSVNEPRDKLKYHLKKRNVPHHIFP